MGFWWLSYFFYASLDLTQYHSMFSVLTDDEEDSIMLASPHLVDERRGNAVFLFLAAANI
jgi:hypothetical protein